MNGQIDANFSSPNLEACGSLQTTFFDQSTSVNSIINWAWDLGGNTSSKQNPGAIFTNPGQYTICLTVTDVDGNSDTECKENYITIFLNPTADFNSDLNEGCAPLNINFTDLSSSANGSITSWLWDIGGSIGVINTQNSNEIITSSYSSGGNYSASLTVEDSLGCVDTKTISNFINVFQIPDPDISFDLLSSCQLPWEIQFENNNSDPSVTYFWDFGNGSTYAGISPPTVNYSEVGEYDITIYMESGDCRDTLKLENYIDTDVRADFSYAPIPTCENQSIQFTDVSVIAAESVLWNFGDGITSTEANPLHTFGNSGCFDVTLIRFAGECSDTAVVSCIEVFPIPDIEINIDNQFNCTLPTTIVLDGTTEATGSFAWEFLGGNDIITADSNSVPIVIEEFGEYTVNVTFTDILGCTYTETLPVNIFPFETNIPSVGTSGCVPLTFTLLDSISSQVDVVDWQWSIGNPVILTSSSSTPSFTIQDTGRYDVTLIAENINGCIDTITIEDYIEVGMLPDVNFIVSPLVSCVEEIKQFTDLSSDFVNEWIWELEDVIVSTDQNPSSSFGTPGVFDITLHAGHNGCFDSLHIEDYITILEPNSSFIIEYNCEDPYTVNVFNRSTGADSLFWTLRLSETDSLIFTDSIFGSYTFPDRGQYTLSHYSKSFVTGCEHTFTDTIRIVDPIASYTLDTLRGCAPLEIQLGDFSQDAFTYEYLTDAGTIDSIFNSEPTITFTEGGIINGPLLVITDIHECKDSFQLMDSVIVNRLEADVEFPDVICIPDNAELKDKSVDVLGNKILWYWSIGNGEFESSSMDTTIYIDSVGMYDLYFKVTDDWGCVDSIWITKAINAVELVPDFIADTLGCTSAPISFFAEGNNGNVETYFWDFGDGNFSSDQNPEHKYENEGKYSICLTLSDSRGCEKTICKENIVAIIDPKAFFAGDPLFATCPPLLTNFQNASEDAIKYIWNFGDNSGRSENESPSHVYTSPGRYDVMLIAQSTSKCFDTLLIEEYVRVEGPSGDFTFDLALSCIPISVDLFADSDGYYSYTWDYGNGVLDSVPGLVISDTTSYVYSETGIFTPKLIITDSIGCSRSFAGNPIIVNDVDLDFLKDTEPQCGPPLDVSVHNVSFGTTSDISYTWFIEGPQNYNSNDSSPVFNILESGLYTVNLIAQYDNCIDTLTKPDYLEIAEIPMVSFEILTDEFCENVNAEFLNTSTVGYGEFVEWSWDFGDGDTSNIERPIHQYSGQESRTITLIGITDKGCEASFSSSFDVLPSMLGDAGEDQLICIGDEAQLNGEIDNLLEGGTFYWEEDPSLSCQDCLSPIANPQNTSSYIFVTIHPNGCESQDTLEVIVIPIPGPELSLTSDSIICLGSESTIIVDNFNNTYHYVWNTNVLGQDCYEDCEQINVSPDSLTSYFVTVYNEFGCFKSAIISIDIESSFVDFLPPEKGICEGESTTIEITAGNNPMWTPNVDIACITCPKIEVSPSKSKKYYLVVESDLGCKYQDSIRVIVIPEGSVNAGLDQEICLGESIDLNATGIGQPHWTPSDIVSDSSAYFTSAQPDSSGYILLLLTYDECTQSDSLYVEVHTQAEISAIGDSICVGETAILFAEGKADHYEWILEDGTSRFGDELEMSAETTKLVQVIGSFRSCLPDTAEARLYVYPKIEYQLEKNNYTLHLNDEIRIHPSFDSTRNYQFEWTPEFGLDCVDCADPIISGLMEHTEYSLTIQDEDSGCLGEYQINVRFQNECTQNVFHLPNIFSPNGDGMNDMFSLITKNPEEFISMSIFDRWGSLIFNSNDINKGWNGRKDSTKVETGVYVYQINLICPFTNENYVVLGDVTVIY